MVAIDCAFRKDAPRGTHSGDAIQVAITVAVAKCHWQCQLELEVRNFKFKFNMTHWQAPSRTRNVKFRVGLGVLNFNFKLKLCRGASQCAASGKLPLRHWQWHNGTATQAAPLALAPAVH